MTSPNPDIKIGYRYCHTASGHTIVVIDSDTAEGSSHTIQYKLDEYFGVHVIEEKAFFEEYELVVAEAETT